MLTGNVPPIGNEPAKPARANFMYGPGYKYGPIKFSVSAVGFSVDGPDNPLEEQTYRSADSTSTSQHYLVDVVSALQTPNCSQLHQHHAGFGLAVNSCGTICFSNALLHVACYA